MKLTELLKDWEIEKKVFTLTVDNASANDTMQDGLDVLSGTLGNIRDSIKYVKGSQSRIDLFQNCMETVGIQVEAGLVLDISTCWNSTFLMLSRPIQLKDVLRNLAEVDKNYKNFPSDVE
ncbi:PREDICTED: zinc finger BED domain-containing protein RICESLEEPER 2-like [Camelina sativa]|uniref:Zinc finger BED domain-containing protein RICESLEEPER 2-like n=1 Tax=Camelina sativa TaxID=90675 RepID=A0ABM1QFI6_CAMSA|nr:PREDICTED: zinc finger BED domain-containing protein RICESLEEPER 2-like [Camelina sativa]